MNYEHVEIEIKGQIAIVWLNRPEVRNALNQKMLLEIKECFSLLSNDKTIKLIILRGKGTVFCSGGDLNWMQQSINYDYHQNIHDSQILANCFLEIYQCEKPIVVVVQGASMGGGNGLIAACDIVLALPKTIYAFTEVKLGIIPAVISPYVIKRIGEFKSKELMLTGRRFNSAEALQIGLINEIIQPESIEAKLEEIGDQILSNGPIAMGKCKKLINNICNTINFDEIVEFTSSQIAKIRVTEEGQEGCKAYLEKRKPNWIT